MDARLAMNEPVPMPQSMPWSPERVLLRVVEVAAAVLVLVEIGLLFVAVVARYAVGAPITWSDELASILFVWLTMLGTAIAFQRGQHMRMTALVSRARGRTAAVLEAAALAVPLAFLLAMVYPATDYALEERIIITPALEISQAWRAFALPTGIYLMLAFAFARIARERLWRPMAVALVIGIAVAAAATAARVRYARWRTRA